jgi:flagellar FliL protein
LVQKGVIVAEEEKVEAPAPAPSSPPSGGKPILFIILLVVNMAFVGGVGVMLYLGNKKKAEKPGIDDVIQGEVEAQKQDHLKDDEDFIGKIVPLETFMVNLAGGRGRKVARVSLKFEIDTTEVEMEIDKRKPQIRDIIIILLSSKKYETLSTSEGKENFREEVRDKLNKFLVKGKIKHVYYTDFILN